MSEMCRLFDRRVRRAVLDRALAAAAALALAWPASAARPRRRQQAAAADKQRSASEKCLSCHDDPEMKSDDGKSLAVSADHFGRSAHRKLECADCHEAALEVRHPRNPLGPVKPQVCQDCHEDEFKAIATSIHGRRANGDRAIKDCTGCHGSLHTVYKGGDPESPLSPVNQIKTCGACHEDMMTNYETSEHARALLKAGPGGQRTVVLQLPRHARDPRQDRRRRRRPTTPRSPTPAAAATRAC